MARRLAWKDVRGGMIALVAIIAIAAGTLKYARVGALHGDTIHVYAAMGEARGILKGSEVWLLGQKIGNVTAVRFQSPSRSDTTSRLVIEMELLDRQRDVIHRDAVAQIRSGGTVIGAVVVALSPGSAGAPPLRDGDTIRVRPQPDVEDAKAQLGAVTSELPTIIANVKAIRSELGSGEGTAGAMLNGAAARAATVDTLGSRIARLKRRLAASRGTGRAVMDGDLRTRMQRAMARADSVRALLSSSRTSLGRFRRDSTLAADVADIRDELASVRTSLAESRGTAGRVLHDSAVFDALGEVHRQMALLVADLKKHPLRYNPF
jgi:phospholipid/cholesterol/gamma-HCH transport system substrate-binding protein